MVQFKNLISDPDNRRVRERIFIDGETIKVFEPSKEEINKIFDMQEKFIDKKNPNRLSLSGKDVVDLFKLLTDIEGINDLTDEEIDKVIENPSMALINAQHAIEGIVTEVYKMVILSMKNRMLETDLRMISAQTSQEVMERTLDLAKKDGKSKEYADKVEKAKAKVLEFKKAQDESGKDISLEAVKNSEKAREASVEALNAAPKPFKQIEKHSNVLSQFRDTFGETKED